MMHETYVNFEQSQILNELGFDWECSNGYYIHAWMDEPRFASYDDCEKEAESYDGTDFYPAPTLAVAQKWLREVKGIAVCVIAKDIDEKFFPGTYYWKEAFMSNFNTPGQQWQNWFIYGKRPIQSTYEEALSDGLTKMLKLIANKPMEYGQQ